MHAWIMRLTMTANGDAYMRKHPTMHMLPMMVVRSLMEWTKVRTKRATTPTNASSANMIRKTLNLFFLSEKMRKSIK